MHTNRFPKSLRLVDRKEAAVLFQRGKIVKLFPLKVFYLEKSKEELRGHKVLFAVPRKKIPSAVQRNRVKRLCREAYRLHKHVLLNQSNPPRGSFLIGYVYVGNPDAVSYAVCSKAVVASLQYLHRLHPP